MDIRLRASIAVPLEPTGPRQRQQHLKLKVICAVTDYLKYPADTIPFRKGLLEMNRSVALLFVFLACGLAPHKLPIADALTHQALELSGFNQSLDQYGRDHGLRSIHASGAWQGLAGRFAEIYTPIMKKRIQCQPVAAGDAKPHGCTLRSGADAQTVQRLQSPLSARMLALDGGTSTPEGQAKIKKYIKDSSAESTHRRAHRCAGRAGCRLQDQRFGD